ncbi:DedA family protein [Rhizohabitans arisaemae]|uniref:DedA family protein n=1 Tax=Rhizohabitans arisaemae TaxID=2720610 RepID=UPI0024B12F76|nr:DedA family protein [Rhizohabitans arisaemae]
MVAMVEALLGFPYALILLGIGLIAFAGSIVGLNVLLPNGTAVVILATTATDPLRFAIMLAVVAVAVSGGDHVDYWLGRRYGGRVRETRLVGWIGRSHWDRVLGLLERYGPAALLVTRLIPVVRTVTPVAVGASRVRYLRFLPVSLLGGLMWGSLYVGIGVFAGASAQYVERQVGRVGGIVLLIIVIAAVLAWSRYRRHRVRVARESGEGSP